MRRALLLAPAALALAACLPLPGARPTPAQDFATYCAACHGATGKGDGAPEMQPKPADLTTLSARNKGKFPMTRVLSQIDGYSREGAPGMPAFGSDMKGELVQVDLGDGVLTPVPARLLALAQYVQGLQAR